MLKLLQIVFLRALLVLLISTAQASPVVLAQTSALASGPATASPAKSAKKQQKVKRPRQHRRGCVAHASPRYQRMIRRWSRVPQIRRPRYRDGYRELVIYDVNHGERVRVFPFLADGALDPQAVEKIQHLFRDKNTDAEHPIDPRLIKLIYKLADTLKARQVNIISGYREPNGEQRFESRHCKGKAADIIIPGVPLAVVARKARALGHVGVGFYPNSGFVHLDVRKKRSYFWVDRSGPGQPSCHVSILQSAALKFDKKWKPRHDEPEIHKNKKGEPKGERTILPEPDAEAHETDHGA